MISIKIDMKQFNQKWKVYSDNVDSYETILKNSGSFSMISNSERYTNWLNEFNIFYTIKGLYETV